MADVGQQKNESTFWIVIVRIPPSAFRHPTRYAHSRD